MPKVLISFYQSIIDIKNPNGIICVYESFAKELSNFGNEVLCVNLMPFKNYNDSVLTKLLNSQKEKLVSRIKKFKPDIIFTFNNQICKEIIDNTSCPICLTDADGINLFANKDFIKTYNDRYYLCSFYEGWEDNQYSSLGFENDKIMFLHMATSVKNEKIEKTCNISFIGTKFGELPNEVLSKAKSDKEILNDLISYYNNQYKKANNFIEKYTEKFDCKVVDLYPLMDSRLYVLQSILDLGLKIYGVRWNCLPKELISLRLAYDKTAKYTLKDNQDVYNSSKVNISVSHPQCKGYAFPWRIYDIMASNGLLICSYSKLLEDKTKEIVDIPMFKSPYDARELCKYALNNPSYCEDIIALSNKYIEKYGRWKENFDILSENLDINLIADFNLNKDFEVFDEITVTPKKEKKTFIRRLKTIIYSLVIAIMQIPVFDKFHNKEKLAKKLNKYWR